MQNKNISHYKKYYKNIKIGDIINVNIHHLPKYSKLKIDVICDICKAEKK